MSVVFSPELDAGCLEALAAAKAELESLIEPTGEAISRMRRLRFAIITLERQFGVEPYDFSQVDGMLMLVRRRQWTRKVKAKPTDNDPR